MDLEIVNKKENVLLKRTEVAFRLSHPKEKTPQRMAVRDKIAAAVGGKREGVIISHMRSRFGSSVTEGYAKVYDSPESAKKMEPEHLLKRHGLVEAKAAEAKPAEKAPAKPEGKPAEAKAPPKAEAKPAAKPEAKPAEKHAPKEEAKSPEKAPGKAEAKPAEKHAAKPAEKK